LPPFTNSGAGSNCSTSALPLAPARRPKPASTRIELVGTEHLDTVTRWLVFRPAQHRIDPGCDDDRRFGFHDVIVGAGVQRLGDILILLAGGQHDRRRKGRDILMTPANKLESAQRRHVPVDDQKIERVALERGT
jgi:hypothetical protein